MTDDYEAIRRLSYEYVFRLDAGDFDGVADLLGAGALFPAIEGVRAEGLRGGDAIRGFYADQVVTFRNGDPRTRHLISCHAIDVNAERSVATGRCYFTVLQAPPRLPYQIILGGQYRDRFARENEEWQFVEKVIHVDYLNDVSHHFKIADPHRAHR